MSGPSHPAVGNGERFEAHILNAVAAELGSGPFGGVIVRGGTSESPAEAVGQFAQGCHGRPRVDGTGEAVRGLLDIRCRLGNQSQCSNKEDEKRDGIDATESHNTILNLGFADDKKSPRRAVGERLCTEGVHPCKAVKHLTIVIG